MRFSPNELNELSMSRNSNIFRDQHFGTRFQEYQSNYEATGNICILSKYPSTNSNRKNLKIPKKMGQKLKKNLGVHLDFFFQFLSKKLFLNF